MSQLLRVPVRSRYGLRAVFDLAYHAEGGSALVREIARRQAVPERYLEQVMRRLKQEGLVRARRGRRGGYVLARDAAKVTVGDVLRATQGPAGAGRDAGQFPPSAWAELENRVRSVLDALTIADLCRMGREAGLPRSGRTSPMYFI